MGYALFFIKINYPTMYLRGNGISYVYDYGIHIGLIGWPELLYIAFILTFCVLGVTFISALCCKITRGYMKEVIRSMTLDE